MFDDFDALVTARPDGTLFALLESVDLTQLDDATLLEAVAAWRRLQSAAGARAALAAAALSERAAMNPSWPEVAGHVSEPCVAAEELAMRLACSRRSASDLVRAGKAYDGVLWPTADALMAGDIDEAKARVLVRALVEVPGLVALAVQEEVLPRAPRRTPAQLQADVQRALVRVDPDLAAERAALAVEDRRVCRPKALPDGMAGIWAVLPAPAAIALHGELSAVAGAARQAGDPRTLDQLRADALCCAVLARGLGPAGGAARRAVRVDGSAADDLHVAIDVRPRVGGVPGDDGGRGDDDAGGPGAAIGGGDEPPEGLLTHLLAGPRLGADVQVIVPLDAMLGVADGAAELPGYGAISPATAEALAREGTWRRLVTDPLSGTVLDVGRTRYRPPPGLAAHVCLRDGTCVRPGCSAPALGCEIDHTVPFDGAEGGPTADDNLGCLCKRDHLLKTHGGFGLAQVAPGVFEWRTPTGARYVERRTVFGPEPVDQVQPDRVGESDPVLVTPRRQRPERAERGEPPPF